MCNTASRLSRKTGGCTRVSLKLVPLTSDGDLGVSGEVS